MNDPTMELGRRLRAGRTAKGWTLRQAAAETGISNGYLSLIEQGEVKAPSPRYLMALAAQYELSYDELMALAGHPSGPAAMSAGAPRVSGSPRVATSRAGARSRAEPVARDQSGPAMTRVFGTAGRASERADPVGPSRQPDERGGDSLNVASAPERSESAQALRPAPDDDLTDDERQQLMALVIGDMRGLTASDIANVRAFIAGIRATRRR